MDGNIVRITSVFAKQAAAIPSNETAAACSYHSCSESIGVMTHSIFAPITSAIL